MHRAIGHDRLQFKFTYFPVFKILRNPENLVLPLKQVTTRQCRFRVADLEIRDQGEIFIPDLDIIGNFLGSLDFKDVH